MESSTSVSRFQFAWTDESCETLRSMWLNGGSMTAIGAMIGCSRGAVAGKIDRLKLPKRDPNGALAQAIKRRIRPRPNMMTTNARAARRDPFRAPRPPIPAEDRAERPADLPVCRTTFDELSPGGCRWPEGDGPFLFCGEPVLKDRSYCACHCRIAYAPTPGLIRQRGQYEVAA